MRLHERTPKLHPNPLLPVKQLLPALALPLALVHVQRDGRDELGSLLDDGVRFEDEGGIIEGGAALERFEEHPVARDALDGEEEVGLERDLGVGGVSSAALQRLHQDRRARREERRTHLEIALDPLSLVCRKRRNNGYGGVVKQDRGVGRCSSGSDGAVRWSTFHRPGLKACECSVERVDVGRVDPATNS